MKNKQSQNLNTACSHSNNYLICTQTQCVTHSHVQITKSSKYDLLTNS